MSIRVQEPVYRASLPGSAPVRSSAAGSTTGSRKALDGFERPRSVPAGPPLLQRGSVGGQVTSLQQKLHARGLMSAADIGTGRGVFGPRTEAAVRRLQEISGLAVTGVAGPSTWEALTRPQPTIHEVPTDLFTAAATDPRAADTLTDDFTEPMGMARRAQEAGV